MSHPYEHEAKTSHNRLLKSYGAGGQVAEGVHQHERAMHKGEPETKLHLNTGGRIPGRAAGGRLDQRARGGRTKGPSRVNIIISNGGGAAERQQAQQQGMQIGARLASSAAPPAPPPRPPVAPPGAGMMPPGAPGVGGPPPGGMAPPPGMRPPMKRGGGVYPLKGDAGSGGGMGRLQKAGMESEVNVRAHTRRRAGGRV